MPRGIHIIHLLLGGLLLLTAAPEAARAGRPETWARLRSPNFIVVTNANEKQARRVAFQFEMIRAVFRRFFNIQGSATDPPVIIIAAKDEATLMPLLPEGYQAKGSMHPAGIYVGGPEKNYVALRLDATLNREAQEPFEPIYHEYIHYLTRRSISQIPLWLSEGLAEFYGNTRVESKVVFVGAPSGTNLAVLHQNPLLPLSTLFAVNASSPYYHENNKASIFYAESWVLTHYLMTRDWHDHTERTRQFVVLMGKNVAPQEAAAATIGSLTALDGELRNYIQRLTFLAARIPAPAEIDANDFTPELISEAESLALRADFLVHTRRYTNARQMLEQSMKADPKLAAAYESMGLLYTEQNKFDQANAWYSQAVALNSQSCLTNYYYAANLLRGELDEGLAAKAESSLRTAIKINASFAPGYEALAYLLSSRHRNLQEAQRLALEAVTLEPGNVRYRLRVAQLLAQMDHTENAIRVATLATLMAKTPEDLAQAQSVLNNLRQFQEYRQKVQEQRASQKAQAESTTGRNDVGSQPDRVGSSEPQLPAANTTADESQPPPLRHRNEGIAGGPHSSGQTDGPSAARTRPELLTRRDVADGTITESRCSGGITLELTVTSPSGTHQLYSDNYFKVPYSALNYAPHGILNPCVDMKGMRARITYHPEEIHPGQGEIVSVQLVK